MRSLNYNTQHNARKKIKKFCKVICEGTGILNDNGLSKNSFRVGVGKKEFVKEVHKYMISATVLGKEVGNPCRACP